MKFLLIAIIVFLAFTLIANQVMAGLFFAFIVLGISYIANINKEPNMSYDKAIKETDNKISEYGRNGEL